MIDWINRKRFGPIGVDIGSRSVKLVQLSADRSRLIDATRWDLPVGANADAEGDDDGPAADDVVEALRRAREGRGFRGRDAVLCMGPREVFVQNIRIPRAAGDEFERLVHREAAGKLPFSLVDAELRYVQSSEVRQGDSVVREVIVMACLREVIQQQISLCEQAGLHPVAIDVEPAALLRSYLEQYRREEDQQQRAMLVHIGYSNSLALVTQGPDVLFVKYIEIGGKHFDEAVARHLDMPMADAASLRRHNGDRRTDQQDPEIARTIAEALRPVVDRLADEISMCNRYQSVTFRGKPLARLVVSGGETTSALCEALGTHLNLKCDLGDPLRNIESTLRSSRQTQWDLALGLALRPVEK